MSDDSSRRDFLRWIGLGGSAAAASGLIGACSDAGGSVGFDDAGSRADAGSGDAAAGDAAGGADVADAGGLPDSSADVSSDTGVPADTDTPDAAPDGETSADTGDSCRATGSDVEGPFHAEGAPERTTLAPSDEPGERLMIDGTVYAPDCRTPLSDALLDVWHANEEGDYYDAQNSYRLRGQMMADQKGRYAFETIKPGNYPLNGTTRPAHIHFNVSAPGYQPLTTQLYFQSDPHLAPNDPCTGCNSGDPTLIIELSEERMNGSKVLKGTFDIVLEA